MTAVVIFAFNRPIHLESTLKSLSLCKNINLVYLYFFIDGPRNEIEKVEIEKVYNVIKSFEFINKEVIKSDVNIGLRDSVINGLNFVFNRHNQAIILEDDLTLNENFINFHLECLKNYFFQQNIWSISGYVIPKVGMKVYEKYRDEIFIAQRASSWGWSTWKDRWENSNFDKKSIFKKYLIKKILIKYSKTGGDKIRMLQNELLGKSSSWAILWDFNHFINDKYCIYPYNSFVKNIGLDNTGTHSKANANYDVDLKSTKMISHFPKKIELKNGVLHIFSKINKKFYRFPIDLYNYIKLIYLSLK